MIKDARGIVAELKTLWSAPLSAYACAMPCPVLTQGLVASAYACATPCPYGATACYAMSGTNLVYGPTSGDKVPAPEIPDAEILGIWHYALPTTILARSTSMALPRTAITCGADVRLHQCARLRRTLTPLRCARCSPTASKVPPPYAMSGTDIAYDATHVASYTCRQCLVWLRMLITLLFMVIPLSLSPPLPPYLPLPLSLSLPSCLSFSLSLLSLSLARSPSLSASLPLFLSLLSLPFLSLSSFSLSLASSSSPPPLPLHWQSLLTPVLPSLPLLLSLLSISSLSSPSPPSGFEDPRIYAFLHEALAFLVQTPLPPTLPRTLSAKLSAALHHPLRCPVRIRLLSPTRFLHTARHPCTLPGTQGAGLELTVNNTIKHAP
eukprot:3067128-Rhodomonas_salina.1